MENTDKTQPGDATNKAGNKPNDKPANNAPAANKPQNQTQPNAQGDKGGNQPNAAQNSGGNSQLADQVGNALHGDTDAIKDVFNQAKESTGQVASQAYGVAAKKATSVIGEQKANLTEGLSSVADSIRKMGESLRGTEQPTGVANLTAQYSDTLADKVEQISGYIDKKDLSGLVRDIRNLAHNNPALFLGGAFTLGILAARFLKSGNSNQSLMRRPQNQGNRGNRQQGNFDAQRNSADRQNNDRNNDRSNDRNNNRNNVSSTTGGGTSPANAASQNKGG